MSKKTRMPEQVHEVPKAPEPDPQLLGLVNSLQRQANNLGISLANARLNYLRAEAELFSQIQQLGSQIENVNRQINEKLKQS